MRHAQWKSLEADEKWSFNVSAKNCFKKHGCNLCEVLWFMAILIIGHFFFEERLKINYLMCTFFKGLKLMIKSRSFKLSTFLKFSSQFCLIGRRWLMQSSRLTFHLHKKIEIVPIKNIKIFFFNFISYLCYMHNKKNTIKIFRKLLFSSIQFLIICF